MIWIEKETTFFFGRSGRRTPEKTKKSANDLFFSFFFFLFFLFFRAQRTNDSRGNAEKYVRKSLALPLKFNQVYTRIPRTTHEYESISMYKSQNPVQCTQYVQNAKCYRCRSPKMYVLCVHHNAVLCSSRTARTSTPVKTWNEDTWNEYLWYRNGTHFVINLKQSVSIKTRSN